MNDERQAVKRLSEGTAPSAPFAPSLVGALASARPALLALVLVVPAGGMALSRHFDGLYGQDAYAYFHYATDSVRSSIAHVQPLEAFFWPPGYPVLVALAELATGQTNPLTGQLVSLVMGALVPVFTALLVRELFPDELTMAALAGVLVALCGQLWQSSIVVMADTAGLALATLSAWALVHYASKQHVGWFVVASAALAYATLDRWIYGLVGLPFAAYALWALPRLQPTRAVVHALSALAIAIALLLPVLGPSLQGLLSHPAEPAPFAGNLQVYSWSPLNALRREFETIDGHLSYTLPNGVYYALAPGNLAFFGPLLAPWAAPGLWGAARQWRKPVFVLIVGWAAIVYAFHAGAPWQNFRFTLAYLPPLAILVASGLVWAGRVVDRRVAKAVAACGLLGLVVMAGGGVRVVQGFIDRKDDELGLVRWVEAQTETGAQLLAFGPTLAFQQYSSRPTLDLFEVSPNQVSAVLADGTPTYVVVDEPSLQQQWLGQPPAANFERLRAEPGVLSVGTHASYTLFRVGRP